MFRLVAILGNLTTKQLKTDSSQLSPYDSMHVSVQIKVKVTLEQATKAPRVSRGIALFFL